VILERHNVKLLCTPPESPDLNPIENVWHKLKHFLRTVAKPKSKEELFAGIQTFWATMTLEKFSDLPHKPYILQHLLEYNSIQLTGMYPM
jgi:transposase